MSSELTANGTENVSLLGLTQSDSFPDIFFPTPGRNKAALEAVDTPPWSLSSQPPPSPLASSARVRSSSFIRRSESAENRGACGGGLLEEDEEGGFSRCCSFLDIGQWRKKEEEEEEEEGEVVFVPEIVTGLLPLLLVADQREVVAVAVASIKL
jgi:hypothetical protein